MVSVDEEEAKDGSAVTVEPWGHESMALWLTGAGLDAADAGLQFVSVRRSLGEATAAVAPDEVAVIEQPAEEVRAAVERWRTTADLDLRGEDLWAVDDWSITENEYREAYY